MSERLRMSFPADVIEPQRCSRCRTPAPSARKQEDLRSAVAQHEAFAELEVRALAKPVFDQLASVLGVPGPMRMNDEQCPLELHRFLYVRFNLQLTLRSD
jgi:hypothetical protein